MYQPSSNIVLQDNEQYQSILTHHIVLCFLGFVFVQCWMWGLCHHLQWCNNSLYFYWLPASWLQFWLVGAGKIKYRNITSRYQGWDKVGPRQKPRLYTLVLIISWLKHETHFQNILNVALLKAMLFKRIIKLVLQHACLQHSSWGGQFHVKYIHIIRIKKEKKKSVSVVSILTRSLYIVYKTRSVSANDSSFNSMQGKREKKIQSG